MDGMRLLLWLVVMAMAVMQAYSAGVLEGSTGGSKKKGCVVAPPQQCDYGPYKLRCNKPLKDPENGGKKCPPAVESDDPTKPARSSHQCVVGGWGPCLPLPNYPDIYVRRRDPIDLTADLTTCDDLIELCYVIGGGGGDCVMTEWSLWVEIQSENIQVRVRFVLIPANGGAECPHDMEIRPLSGDCVDTIDNCAAYPTDWCETYTDWANENCPHTCGVCDGDCVDTMDNCASFPSGVCTTSPDWAYEFCRLFCGLCDGTGGCMDNMDCSSITPGICALHPDWAMDNCELTCGLCGGTGCMDAMDCSSITPEMCALYPDWAMTNCQLTCDLCEGGACDWTEWTIYTTEPCVQRRYTTGTCTVDETEERPCISVCPPPPLMLSTRRLLEGRGGGQRKRDLPWCPEEEWLIFGTEDGCRALVNVTWYNCLSEQQICDGCTPPAGSGLICIPHKFTTLTIDLIGCPTPPFEDTIEVVRPLACTCHEVIGDDCTKFDGGCA